jgi:ATP-binding cassette subfamily B protein
MPPKTSKQPKKPRANMFSMLPKYMKFSALLILATIAGNGLSLFVPRFIANGIDMFGRGEVISGNFYIWFVVLSIGIFLLTYFQGVFQTYLSEKVAFDTREQLADKISQMTFVRLEKETPAKLLTNLTSDIDAVKTFFSMGVATIVSSIIVIIGAAALLFSINWKLALAVLVLLPLIGVMFFTVFKKLGPLFKKSQELIDGFNGVMSESVVGAAIVRVFNSGSLEHEKFNEKNTEARTNGLTILRYFCIVIPAIGIIASLASLIILVLGGHYVIIGSMTIGQFTAFNSYVFILIFPLIMLGFVSNIISQAQASYDRIKDVLNLPNEKDEGTYEDEIKGNVEVKNVTLSYGEKNVLDNVSFTIPAKTRTAIIGPTAAGKTQLLQVMMGLTIPEKGEIRYDGKLVSEYTKAALYSQIALVFQESVLFNLSLLENISFSNAVKDSKDDERVKKAIETAELHDFIHTLPKGLDSLVSERGTSLSGGQKQRIMLARALALNPRVLLLDDFTARVDNATEQKILSNIEKNYPGITVISVTQKIQSIEHFDKIILLMEGEVIAEGTHKELSETSPEYVQIMESQKSTENYE